MARIIIKIRKKTPHAPAKVSLECDYSNRDTTAERNLMVEIADSLAESWHLGEVKRPPEPTVPGLDRIKG